MCGIAGIFALGEGGQPPQREELLRMAAALYHRGPDQQGLYRDARTGLAHTRLSIVDLASGEQPLCNEDGTLWIAFNGEVFNYVELRAALEDHGHRFRTRSDTEVIVHAYEQWGDEAFARMNGQWAVALWDATAQRLVLTRDRLGVRPLYVTIHRGRLYFASEVKALFAADPSMPRALDPLGIEQTLTFWSVVPPQSVFQGVEELPPALVRSYGPRGLVRDHVYWRPQYPEETGGDYDGIEESTESVRSALADAVSLRMLRADVPVGSYVSGGLDSSLVAVLARQHAGPRFHTFSLRFQDAEYDETLHQRALVKALGSDHHEVVVGREDIAAALPDVISHTERPILRTAPVPLYLLSQLVRRHGIKVVLTGEGADEMFGGYDLFREGKVRRFWARQPGSRLRPRLLERLYPYLARSPVTQQTMARQFFGAELHRAAEPGFAHGTRWRTTAALKRLLSPAVKAAVAGRDVVAELIGGLPPEFSRWTPLAQDQYLEIRTLLTGYLLSSQGDRMLMAHSVEGRFPFLDANVMRLAEGLPPSHKLRGLDEKHVLKRAARGLIPDSIIARTKQPYRAPDAVCFAGERPPEYAGDLLGEAAVEAAGIFEPRAVAQLWRKCRAARADHPLSNTDNMALVGVLSTQILHDRFVRRRDTAQRSLSLVVDVDRQCG